MHLTIHVYTDENTDDDLSENSLLNKMIFDRKYGMLMKDMDFEVDYQPTLEEEKKYFIEERIMKIDNVGVERKRTLFETFY